MNPIHNLRQYCVGAEEAQKNLAALDQKIAAAQAQRETLRGNVAYAIGGRDAVAASILPEGMKLGEAWDQNWQGLREDLPKKGPKAVESGPTESAAEELEA